MKVQNDIRSRAAALILNGEEDVSRTQDGKDGGIPANLCSDEIKVSQTPHRARPRLATGVV